MYERDSYRIVEHRYGTEDRDEISNWWMEYLRSGIQELPEEWIDRIEAKLTPAQNGGKL